MRVPVTTGIMYDYGKNEPVVGGPLDLRLVRKFYYLYYLGCRRKGRRCYTCNEDLVMCPGHFGYIQLDLPVYHVGYFKHIVNVLQCICKECSRILLSE